MPHYQEWHNETIDKNVGVLNLPNSSFCFSNCVIGYIRSNQIFPSGSRTLALFLNRIYATLGQTYPMYQTYPSLVGFQYRDHLAWSDISDQPDMSSPHQVPESWQAVHVKHIRPQVRYIRPTRSVWPSSGSRSIASLLDRIYPSPNGYIRPSQIQASLNLPSDISNLGRIYPMFWHLQQS
jgi:hypothetical protein